MFTGAYAINPVNDERIPIWIADYVMITYGTGAIMAVPSGDQRDFEFARKFGLKIIPVIQPEGEHFDGDTMTEAYDGAGYMINSGRFNGTFSDGQKGRKNPAISAVMDWIEERGIGKEADQLPPARLADLPPALLGFTHSRSSTKQDGDDGNCAG